MSVPQPTPGAVAVFPDIASTTAQGINNAALYYPTTAKEFLQNKPVTEFGLRDLFASLAAFSPATPSQRINLQCGYRDNMRQVLRLNAQAGGAPGASVTYTIAPSSHLTATGTPLLFPNHSYLIGQAQVVGRANGLGSITRTSGAWTITLTPDPGVSLPTVVQGEPMLMLQPNVVEGNTVHSGSGRAFDLWATSHKLVPIEHEKFKATDLAVMDDVTWTQMPNGAGQHYLPETLRLAMNKWEEVEMFGMLFATGNATVAQNGAEDSEGLFHWIRNSGVTIPGFSGTLTEADFESWIDIMINNQEGITDYMMLAGNNFYRAVQKFCSGGFQVGQMVQISDSHLDPRNFRMITLNGNFNFHFPWSPNSEFNNEDGLGAFGYRDRCFLLPMGEMKNMVMSGGTKARALEWKFLENQAPIVRGPQGARAYHVKVPPNFSRGASITGEGNTFVIPHEDAIVEFGCRLVQGSFFKKAWNFFLIEP